MFDTILLTFVIEIKCRAEFESCLRNQKETSSERMGFLFGYDSMLRSYHLRVMRPTSVARWAS